MLQTKILDEYPNYVIYSDGRIWSNTSEKFMSLAPNQDGYLGTVITNKDGKRVSVKAHRLVALAFIPNPNGYLYVNHIDENPQNNNVENLEWITCSDNLKHAYKNGLKKIPEKQKEFINKINNSFFINLDNLIVLYDSNNVSLDSKTDKTLNEVR